MKRIVGILVFGFAMMLGQLSFAASADRDYRSTNNSESRSESRSERREARRERAQERAQQRIERRQLRREAREVRSVPELDGGFALLAFGLVAGVALVIRERRRK